MAKLTRKEILVLKRLGKTDAEISCEFGTMLNTTHNQVRRVLLKLDVENRTQAVIKAIQLGLIDPYQFII